MELVRPPIVQTAPKAELKKPKRPKKLLWIVLIGLIVLTAGLAVGYMKWPRDKVVVSENVKKSVDFSVASPKQIPKGFSIEKQPYYETDKRIVITVFEDKNGSKITVSQQKKPENIDLKQIDAAETFLANIGTVYILKGEPGQYQSIIETNGSWIYVNASKQIGLEAYKSFMENLAIDSN